MTPQQAQIIRKLSVIQRKTLVRHIDAVIPYIAATGAATRVLLDQKLLKPASQIIPFRATRLTTFGREVACFVLAEYAEILIMAGYDVSPLERLRLRPIAQAAETIATIATDPRIGPILDI